MPATILTNAQLWAWLAIALAAGFIVWLLSPILAPFVFAAILAYIFDPLVERLTRRRVPRTLAVVLVLLLVLAMLVALLLVVLPVFYKEMRLLMEKLPAFIAWFNAHAAPWLKERIGLHPVVVIFALLAFGHVFGFFGVLIALPASAALLVGLRHLRGAYVAGPLYGGE